MNQPDKYAARSAVFLHKIFVRDLNGINFNHTFSNNRHSYNIEEVTLETEEEADAWSKLIEIISCIACADEIPYRDENWQIVIFYERWDTPLVLFNRPSEKIKVILSCNNGVVSENAYEISGSTPVPVPNDYTIVIPANKSKLPSVIIDDFYYFNLYRWNPRLNEDRVLTDDKDYFLSMHDKWCSQDRELYEQEMNAVLKHMFPESFSSIEAIPHSTELYPHNPKRFNYIYYDTYSNAGTLIHNCEDEVQNFFYSYVEFKRYKDYESGMFGLFLTDCYTSIYINLYRQMLNQSYSEKNSQFIFIRWSDSVLEEKNKSKFAYRNKNR